MLVPMMLFLFVVFTAGLLGGVVLYAFRTSRCFAGFMLAPVLAAIGAMGFCWVLAIGLEHLLASQRAGGIGFLAGYIGGGLLGAGLGAWWGFGFFIRHRAPNISFQRTAFRGR